MAQKTADFEVLIIGGGPAGLSAGLWCADLGLRAIIFEKEAEFGGQLLRTFNAIRNYLGVDTANGREMRDLFLRQVEKTNVRRLCNAAIAAIDLVQKTIILADGTRYSGRAVIIATGVSRRKLGVPGETDFEGRGILESGEKAKNEVAGKRILIVGGGDAALENSLILSRTAGQVFVVHRRDKFSARAEFVERAARTQNIEFIFQSQVTAIIGNEAVEAVDVKGIPNGMISPISVNAVLIRVGVEPNTRLFRGQIALNAVGFISTDNNFSTDLPGVFAIGDVANGLSPTISGAVGMGAAAAKVIRANFNSLSE